MVSSVAVAEVSAARLLLMPLVLVQTGWNKVILPHGSRLREENRLPRLFKEQVIVSIVFVFIVISLVFIAIFLKPLLLNVILSDKYANSFDYIFYFGAIFSMGFIALSANLGLQVLKKFDVIVKINFFTMLATLLSAYLLILSYGIIGGLIALLIGQTISAILLWIFFAKASYLKSNVPIVSNKIE